MLIAGGRRVDSKFGSGGSAVCKITLCVDAVAAAVLTGACPNNNVVSRRIHGHGIWTLAVRNLVAARRRVDSRLRRGNGNGQQAEPVNQIGIGERRAGLDNSRLEFKVPVGVASDRLTGKIVGGRDIGSGEQRQFTDKVLALCAGGNSAAIQQQIGLRVECLSPGSQLVGVVGKRLVGQVSRTNQQCAVISVRKHVNCRDIPGVLQVRSNLFDAALGSR